jgi:hypothetical protein
MNSVGFTIRGRVTRKPRNYLLWMKAHPPSYDLTRLVNR